MKNVSQRIDLTVVDTIGSKIVEPIEFFILLEKNFFTIQGKWHAKEYRGLDTDEDIEQQVAMKTPVEAYRDFTIKTAREVIDKISIHWSPINDCWAVSIEDMEEEIFFETEASARKFYNTLDNYFFHDRE